MNSIKKIFADIPLYLAGGALVAVSISCFAAPNDIAAGGFSGVGTLLNYLFSLAHEADAEMNILSGADVPAVIADYARRESACMLLLGTDRTGIFQKLQILLPETEIVICP